MVFTLLQLVVCVAIGCTGQLRDPWKSYASMHYVWNTDGNMTS